MAPISSRAASEALLLDRAPLPYPAFPAIDTHKMQLSPRVIHAWHVVSKHHLRGFQRTFPPVRHNYLNVESRLLIRARQVAHMPCRIAFSVTPAIPQNNARCSAPVIKLQHRGVRLPSKSRDRGYRVHPDVADAFLPLRRLAGLSRRFGPSLPRQ